MRRRLAVAALSAVVLAGCSGDPELTVAAAASLTEAFTGVGAAFEARNPGVTVTFDFGPSDGLATRIVEGSPVDVFASASPMWMDAVRREVGVDGSVSTLARNRLAILVPPDNPAGISNLDDLAGDGVRLVLAAEGVPAGDYAREVLENAGILDGAIANVVSNEEDVAGVLTKVVSGDADAGIAYTTDAAGPESSRVVLVPIPDGVNVIATYPIAVLSGSSEPDLARRFVRFALGQGQQTLADLGFLPPA